MTYDHELVTLDLAAQERAAYALPDADAISPGDIVRVIGHAVDCRVTEIRTRCGFEMAILVTLDRRYATSARIEDLILIATEF